jgi:hypothetical protein
VTIAREAITLPLVFLTVALLGGLRIGDATVLVPPSPYALVLGLLLLRVIVQSGALAPERLLSASRSELANLNGAIVLAALWIASAQAIAVLIPESGLPRLAFGVFFLILLLNTSAASPDRPRMLRSLAVTFGSAFLLKFVVLNGVSTPGEGAIKRALLALLDSVTVGTLVQPASHPVAAYAALAAIVLFLVGVLLLPRRELLREGLVPRVTLPVE